MKRIAILLLVIGLAGCTTKEELILNDDTVYLVLNAQLKAEETSHVAWLSHATSDQGIRPVRGGKVTVSVNGGAPVTATELPEIDGFYENAVQYAFSQTFRPRDEVYIEASDGTRQVSARVLVPDAPDVVSVDTATVFRKGTSWFGDAYESEALQVKVVLRDHPGQADYYRISGFRTYDFPEGNEALILDYVTGEPMRDDYTGEYYIAGKPDPISEEENIYIDVSEEPLISGSEGGDGGAAEMIAELFEMQNDWCLFTDTAFEGESYTLRLYLQDNVFLNYGFLAPGSIEDYLLVHAISFDQFHYLKALSAPDDAFFSEPVSMPSNVEGGLGFVTVETSYKVKIRPWKLTYYEYDEMTDTYRRL